MTNEARSILENIIEDFEPEKFVLFFRRKSPQFSPAKEDLQHYNDENFTQAQKLGEIKFADSDRLIICTLSAQKPLTERSGKKAQYDKAKKFLENSKFIPPVFLFFTTKTAISVFRWFIPNTQALKDSGPTSAALRIL